jgi:hypothetical protein
LARLFNEETGRAFLVSVASETVVSGSIAGFSGSQRLTAIKAAKYLKWMRTT